MKIKALLSTVALVLSIHPCFGHSSHSKSVSGATESKSFQVSRGGALEVTVSGGDIIVSSWDKNVVTVLAEGLDPESQRDLRMDYTGNTVRVDYRPHGEWDGDSRFTINVPVEFNSNLETSGGNIELRGLFKGKLDGSSSGGDIKLADVDGTVNMDTSGGNIAAGKINGTVSLKTSGGDIEVATSSGQVELYTSGGNISIGNVGKSLNAKTSGGDVSIGDVGGEAVVTTAGGDIHVGKVSGNATLKTAGGDIILKGGNGIIRAKTAGGNVSLRNITGSIDAGTAGGDVEAELRPSGSGSSRLNSSGGDVVLYVPESAKATIEATINVRGRWKNRSEDYEIASDFKPKSYDKDEEAKEIRGVYVLNGGGESIILETVNGNIEIRSSKNVPPQD